MRIAMIANTRYESDARVRRAARALAERGHHVDFFAVSGDRPRKGGNEQFLCLRRLRIRRQHAAVGRYFFEYGVFFAWSMTLVSILHLRSRYDIIYVHNMPNFLVFAGLVPKIGGAKIVLDVHDPAAELLASLRGSELPAWLRVLARAEERASLALADAVVTVNEPMRERLSAMFGGPVTVVMNLPDTAVMPPVDADGPDGRNRIVYSGSIAHRNGVDLIVKALSLLEGEFPRLRLRIVGDGPATESVRGLAKELGVTERVEFAGFVTNDEIPFLVSGAAAGISPQRDDAFGSARHLLSHFHHAALLLRRRAVLLRARQRRRPRPGDPGSAERSHPGREEDGEGPAKAGRARLAGAKRGPGAHGGKADRARKEGESPG
jgi:glycosyltransferase involved in cell wall biosynthesis